MIHFDTNALIAIPVWARTSHPVLRRIDAGESAATSAIAWFEYANGPLADDEATMARTLLQDRIVPLTGAHADLAAKLFNATGRKRAVRIDALVAAVAIAASAELVTINVADFRPFVAHGLRLIAG